MAEPNRRRLYQAWKGSNKFFCGGRLVFGPDVGSLFLSTVLIASPLVGLCCQSITKLHSSEKQVLGMPVLIVTFVIGIMDLAFLFLTSSRDPGIIPRNARPPECDESIDITTPSTEWLNAASPHLRLPRTKDVLVNGFVIKVKYCDTCLLYRPPRTSHCSICNNCVQKFDHHCPWVGQCIGLRNYRFFFLFISTSTFLCIYVFSLSWLNVIVQRKNYNNSLWKSMTGEVLSLVLIIYTFIAVWFVGGLTVFHLYLTGTNQTTYENFRYRYDKKENPYNKGVFTNIAEVFFSWIPPSMNNFRSWVVLPEDTHSDRYLASTNGISIVNPKEKIDPEMGSKSACDPSIPAILQGIDYNTVESSVHVKARQAVEDTPDPFMLPTVQHLDEKCKRTEEASPIIRNDEERTLGHGHVHVEQ